MIRKITLLFASLFCLSLAGAQNSPKIELKTGQTYTIYGITVSGVKFFDTDQVIALTGLNIGDTLHIPSDAYGVAIRKLWDYGLFSDVQFTATKISGDSLYLNIHLQERPRIVSWVVSGTSKSDRDEIKESLSIRRGSEYSEYMAVTSTDIIKRYYAAKGYLDCQVNISVKNDSVVANGIHLNFEVDRKKKIRVKELDFIGNREISSKKLRKAMKETHRISWNIFNSTKFIQKELDNDKKHIIEYYQERGFRDAQILSDSVYRIGEKRVGITIRLFEGNKYFFRNITWVGNTKFVTPYLNTLLKLKKGDVYDKITLEKRLSTDENSISTLYNDEGYLFFNVEAVETSIQGDSIDIELRVYEGKPATINRINIAGNTKTNEHIIRRELYSRPGELFSKTAVMRSIRELAQMGHFDPEKLDVSPVPNPADETVDITFKVEEKPNDQLELSGGWGNNMFVGTVGIKFTNFSARRMFEKDAWRPVPSGDNQTVNIRAQTNGSYYKALNLSFSEPWLGGKKPNSFSASLYYTAQDNSKYFYSIGDQSMKVFGGSVGLGRRLEWPDNYFTLFTSLDYERYMLHNWTGRFLFTDGVANNLRIKFMLSRNSTDQAIYPRSGSNFSLSLQLTPPYSLLNGKDYKDPDMTDQEKYRWIEYHKWNAKAAWYSAVVGDWVVAVRGEFGYLGFYNKNLGYSPFEGFELGGDGMSGYNMYGIETIGLRGYANTSLTPYYNGVYVANVYNKFTMELRYPFILSPQSTIYGLVFFEGGNSWRDIQDFNPLSIKRSAGVGVRLLLPIVGMLGIDWGYGFDKIPGRAGDNGGNFHFLIGMPF